jgi:hypothetical protein
MINVEKNILDELFFGREHFVNGFFGDVEVGG